jgi:ribose transport system ATP-binding protein
MRVSTAETSTTRPVALPGPLLEVNDLSKSWGATAALTSVSLSLAAGEVLAIVGENGAGKSTLLSILSGVTAPDSGTLRLDARAATFASPKAARMAGIGTVFQELSLARNQTVMENIFAGRLPSRLGLVDRKALRRRTQSLLDTLGLDMSPSAMVESLPVSSQQMVEIAKAVSLDARVLLLDEPTSALNADEKAALFRLVGSLKAKGVGIVFISHHLDEVMTLADRVLVLRDGRAVATVPVAATNPSALVEAMVGRAIEKNQADRSSVGEVLLSIDGLSCDDGVSDVSFRLHRGEIVALAGLMGSGRSALAETIVGLSPARAGRVELCGRLVAPGSIAAAKRLGIGYVPPERKTQGLFLDMQLADNIAAARLKAHSRRGLANRASMHDTAEAYRRRLSIRCSDVGVDCRALSGGNQQKVLLAKWLDTAPQLLVVEEPTKGVDIAAKADIHRELAALAAGGAGVLMVSSDLPEILSVAHRVIVMHRGRVVADLSSDRTSEREIVAHASGLAVVSDVQ